MNNSVADRFLWKLVAAALSGLLLLAIAAEAQAIHPRQRFWAYSYAGPTLAGPGSVNPVGFGFGGYSYGQYPYYGYWGYLPGPYAGFSNYGPPPAAGYVTFDPFAAPVVTPAPGAAWIEGDEGVGLEDVTPGDAVTPDIEIVAPPSSEEPDSSSEKIF